MYTLNYKYENKELLKKWLKEHTITAKSECFVQFFNGIPQEDVMQKIASFLSKNLPKAHIIGTTTDGEICDNNVTANEIIISFSLFEKTTIHSAEVEYESDSFNMGRDIAFLLDSDDVKVMILFTSGLDINGEQFLNGVTSIVKGKYIVSGGMAGDNANFERTYISHQSKVISKGAVGVVLKGKELHVQNQYQLGCTAVGLPMKITRSYENRVYELNGVPIIDVYKKYFGDDISELLPKIGIEIPLIIEKDGMSIARACIHKYEDGSLLFTGDIKESELVRFGVGSIELILRDSISIDKEFRNSSTPESIFVYSCMARRHLLGDESFFELRKLTKYCSVSGFYAYGEFYSNNKENHLLNEAITIVTLSESDSLNSSKENSAEKSREDETSENNMMHALTHMTNVIAREWQERIDAEIQKNKEQAQQNFQKNKLAQMGEMIGMIAHQWRQPLSAISATGISLSILSSIGKLEPEKVQESSEFIQNQCQKMSSTIDTFMNFVKPAKESQPFRLSHTVDAIVQIMGTQLSNHNIALNIEITNKNISLVGYEDLLEQVIINILSNARDAFDGLEKADKFINITIFMRNKIPVISIEDNAGGIDESVREKIFNPYFTTKEQGKGTGIGLYMSMDIMKRSFNGDLVYKATNGGTVFEIVCAGGDGK
ncbi:MAG: FIST C-terminal domain-containing protein [Campylobacterales bacterium]|nr:FIST C-terminal domain-containing protein [Campylobacterales bacterium]